MLPVLSCGGASPPPLSLAGKGSEGRLRFRRFVVDPSSTGGALVADKDLSTEMFVAPRVLRR